MRSARALALTLTALTLAWAGSVLGTPSTVSYQGRLATSGGTPVADGDYAVTFTLWTDSVGGSLIWTELQDVHVTGGEGLFTCQLGNLQPLGGPLVIHANDDLYLQTSVSGETLVPRLALGSVPQAFSASSVHHIEPGVGTMEMSVGDDTTRIDASHEGFSTLIDSYVHLVDDRGLLGLRAYGAGTTAGSSSHSEVSVDEASNYLDHDDDGDGIAEVSVWGKVDNTDAVSGTAVDVDDDGDPDVGSSSSAILSRAVLKTFFQTGDFPTQSQVIDSVDASGAYHSIESSDPDVSSSSNVRARINELETKLQTIGLLARSSITNSLTPTTCGVAINTKGTGADKGRAIGSTCDDSSAVQVLEVDEDGDGIAEGKGINSVKVKTSGYATASSQLTSDSDDDGVPETMAEAVASDKFAQVRGFKVEISGARSGYGSSCDSAGATSSIDRDNDGDGESESEISYNVTPTTSSVAIKVKGTGADKDRRIGGTCDDSSATQTMTVDDDGDGHAEATAAVTSVSSLGGGGGGGGAGGSAYARMSSDSDDDGIPENDATMMVTPTTSSVAIKWKGTGADANRTVSSTCDDSSAVHVLGSDEDGDGQSESEISYSVTPTTSNVAIKTKGTGADKDRVIGGTCDDTAAVQVIEVDDDADGIAESRAVISSVSSPGGGGLPPSSSSYARMSSDSDDDGIPENDATMIVTPTTSSVAIKTKGTGADPNRVVGGTDDSTATLLLATDSATISLRTRKGGVVTGTISILSGSALRMVDLGSDGNGFFGTGVGVGVDPTHPIEVSGGAYCDGTNWVNASDAHSKENFESVDGAELLDRISELEITRWNYKGDTETEHIGPTAQDFRETFGVGSDGKSISTIDPSGIALAAIQELTRRLNAQNQELSQENAQLRRDLDELKNLVRNLAAAR